VEFQTHTGDILFVEWKQIHEQVTSAFNLFRRLPIPAGEYDFDRYRAEISSGTQRPISVKLAFEDGDFFGGDRREVFVDFQWRQSEHFFLGLSFSQNAVTLPSGQFTSYLGRLSTDIAFNSRWSWSNFIQYDNVFETVSINSRVRYEPVSGRELLLVMNHGSAITADNSFTSISNDFVAKISYTFRY